MTGLGLRRPLLLLALALALPAAAHEVRPAFLQISEVEPERFEVLWKQPVLADRRLAIDVVMPPECETITPEGLEHTGTALIRRWQTACSLRTGRLDIRGLSATLTDVLVRISYLDGDTTSQVLRGGSPSLDLADPAPAVGAYFLLGVEHLLLGVDHILFVIALVLFVRRPRALITTVTAFTIAHSITLALSVLELVRLPQGPVEAVIALSILFLARELMLPEAARSPLTLAAPWLMAFTFGLLHGFGFAGALAEVGLPQDQLAAALLLFNLGIEAGQLAIVAAMLAVLLLGKAAAGRPPGERPLPERAFAERAFTIAMGCAAGFWTIDRVLALA